jgi:hypothetical protein
MTHSSLIISSFEKYMESEDDSPEERADQNEERVKRLAQFRHALMLECHFVDMDRADQWCWQHFGPRHGDCNQAYSKFRVCDLESPHCHFGKWTTHWFVKTDYDFGFNEWYFRDAPDRESFREFVSRKIWHDTSSLLDE